MSAYVISDISSINPERVRDYLTIAVPSIEPFGGRYLASTTTIDVLEGSPAPARYVIVEFESRELAQQWYGSADYAPARAIAPEALGRRLMIIDGSID